MKLVRRENIVEIRKILKKALHKGYYPPVDIKVPIEIMGSEYGAWAIPLSLLSADSVVYSFGVGNDISFDSAIIEKYGCQVFAFDPTPKSVEWIQLQKVPRNFHFYSIGIASWNGNAIFIPPENPDFVSYRMIDRSKAAPKYKDLNSFPVKCIDTIMSELGHSSVDVVKMDIEGAEYAVLRDMLAKGILPTVLLVEFHHRWPDIGLTVTQSALQNLREAGYRLFYVSDRDEFGMLLQE